MKVDLRIVFSIAAGSSMQRLAALRTKLDYSQPYERLNVAPDIFVYGLRKLLAHWPVTMLKNQKNLVSGSMCAK